MDLQSPRIPTRSSKEKAIDFDLLQLADATSVTTLSTHQELYNLIVNEQLVPGSWYKFPYKSVNFLNGWEAASNNQSGIFTSYNAREIYEGNEEMIIVQAVSTYQIANNAYSESYPEDVIEFAPYTNKIGVNIEIYNNFILPDSSTVSGFDLQWDGTNVYFNMPAGYPALFGHYLYLYCEFDDGVNSYYQDGTYEPLTPGVSNCQYPKTSDDPDYGNPKAMSRLKVVNNGTKVILLDLTESDVNNYVANTLYVNTVYAIGDAYGWITRRTDTSRNISVPFDFRGRKYRRYEVDPFGLIDPQISYGSNGTTATDGIYYNVSAYTTGTGFGAEFQVTVSGGSVIDVRLMDAGRFYKSGDILTIYGSLIGGVVGDDDIQINVQAYSIVGYYSIGTTFNSSGEIINVPSDIYKDFKVFGEDGYIAYDIQWNGIGGPNRSFYAGYSDNNVITGEFYNNVIDDFFYSNTISAVVKSKIGSFFAENVITNVFANCVTKDSFISNTLRRVRASNFKVDSSNNIFASNIDDCNFDNFCIGNRVFGQDFLGNNIGISFYGNNIVGGSFSYNDIGADFTNNYIGSFFQHNKIESIFISNKINNAFAYNSIRNYFRYNTIGDGFGFGYNASQGNTIGNYFENNTIGEYFYNNIIADGFSGNTILDSFQLNNVKVSISSGDFSPALFYDNYNCDVFKGIDLGFYVSYFDGISAQYSSFSFV